MEPIIIKTKGATYIDNDRRALNPDRGEFRKAVIELTKENAELTKANTELTEANTELTNTVQSLQTTLNGIKFCINKIDSDAEHTTTIVYTDITDPENPEIVTSDIQNIAVGVLREHTIRATLTPPTNYKVTQVSVDKATESYVIDEEDITDNTIELILDANIKLTVVVEAQYCQVTVRCTNENFDSSIDVSVTPDDTEGGAGDYDRYMCNVPLGTHYFNIEAAGYEPKTIEVAIIESDLGNTKEVTFTLDPEIVPALASVTLTGGTATLSPTFDPDIVNYVLNANENETITLSWTTNDQSVISTVQTDIEQHTVSGNSITFVATNVDYKYIRINVFKGRAVSNAYEFTIVETPIVPQ